MDAHGYNENSAKILHSYQRCWLIWSSLSLLLTHVLEPTDQSRASGLNFWPSASGSHFPIRSSSFLTVLHVVAGIALYLVFVPKLTKEYLDTLAPLPRSWRWSLFGHPSKETHTYTSMHIYIHTLMLIIVPQQYLKLCKCMQKMSSGLFEKWYL